MSKISTYLKNSSGSTNVKNVNVFNKKLPSKNELLNILKPYFIKDFHTELNNMVNFIENLLNSEIYLNYLSDYQAPNSEFQNILLDLIPKYNNITQKFRVQMVTISGYIFADNYYDRNDGDNGDISSLEQNVYNNPEILYSILNGAGGMRRCLDRQTQSLRFAFGVKNDWGTIVITRVLYDIPE
jgi:hypothetical protein